MSEWEEGRKEAPFLCNACLFLHFDHTDNARAFYEHRDGSASNGSIESVLFQQHTEHQDRHLPGLHGTQGATMPSPKRSGFLCATATTTTTHESNRIPRGVSAVPRVPAIASTIFTHTVPTIGGLRPPIRASSGSGEGFLPFGIGRREPPISVVAVLPPGLANRSVNDPSVADGRTMLSRRVRSLRCRNRARDAPHRTRSIVSRRRPARSAPRWPSSTRRIPVSGRCNSCR